MSLARTLLLPEYDQEIASTRKHLERLPADRMGWSPHGRSWSLAALALHISNIPSWVPPTLLEEGLDLATLPPQEDPAAQTPETLLARFDSLAARGRDALEGVSDTSLQDPWTLRMGEKLFFTLPRYHVYRRMNLNHLVHHRAQLGVYLRLLDIPVPSAYGPTADEG